MKYFPLVTMMTLMFLGCVPSAFAAGTGEVSPAGLVMNLHNDALEFQSEPIEGVLARVHISDVRAEMKKLNSFKSHILVVKFYRVKSGEEIAGGSAAIYIKNPQTNIGFFDPMRNEEGLFVAGLLLHKAGPQLFTVASKLPDGKKRDFQFSFTVKNS